MFFKVVNTKNLMFKPFQDFTRSNTPVIYSDIAFCTRRGYDTIDGLIGGLLASTGSSST